MKYLKTFEHTLNTYWYEITEYVWMDIMRDCSRIDFTNSELDEIAKHVSKLEARSIKSNNGKIFPDNWTTHIGKYSKSRSVLFTIFNRLSEICIYKIDDEWFMLSEEYIGDDDFHIKGLKRGRRFADQSYYKCDQFDGLIKAINHIYHQYKDNWVNNQGHHLYPPIDARITESISEDKDYYELTDYATLSGIQPSSMVDMTQRSIDVLRDVLYPQFHFKITDADAVMVVAKPTNNWRQIHTLSTPHNLLRLKNDVEKLRSILFIQKEDEWYIIKFNCEGWVTYYKCDQIEGVVHCLSDLGIIK